LESYRLYTLRKVNYYQLWINGGEALEKFVIKGGTPLSGKVKVQGAKNAALPIMAASLLAEGVHQIKDVPNLLDIEVMIKILEAIGAKVKFSDNIIDIDTSNITSTKIPELLMSQMRSSIFLMGPLLARFGEVIISKPGGCAIGERKIDLHLKGLVELGAIIEEVEGFYICKATELIGREIFLDYPSVGATENIMMAAVKAKGETKIENAAKEPEIVDLQNYLNKMGANISGAGTDLITIKGVERLNPVCYQVIPDRIVAGTLMTAVGLTGGRVEIENVIPEHIAIITEYLKRIGIEINIDNDIIIVDRKIGKSIKPISRIVTSPYPGFPTDMQAQFMSLLAIADGFSIIEERVFDSRYKHVMELNKFGANIRIENDIVNVYGVDNLIGSEVEATDLRAGAALILAGLAAEGTTIVNHISRIDRGYEKIEVLLQSLGAKITRESV